MKIIGHRGWRGKYPENSLTGFKKLNELGVHAVEIDVVVSKERELIISHEAWFDLTYCLAESEQNLFQLSTEEIQKIDCGSKIHPRFMDQEKFFSPKPTLKQAVDLWNQFEVKPFVALEVKSEPQYYGYYQPYASDFAHILNDFEEEHLSEFDYFTQSFDPVFLKTYHKINPKQNKGLLVEYKANLLDDLDFLNFKPQYYNPEHVLLNDKLVSSLESLSIKTTTWTVNTHEEYSKIKDYPLEGVITDYPERFIES